jgi:putative membrane protein
MMWNCNFGPFAGGGWGGGFFPANLFSLLILAGVVWLVVFLIIRIFRHRAPDRGGPSRDLADSEEILKTRYAKGEISREEFIRMRQTLTRH